MSGDALVADVGGTHARFALCRDGRLHAVEVQPTAAFGGLEAALRDYLARRGPGPSLIGAAVCAAGPESDGVIQMTNCPWIVSASTIRRATGVRRPLLLNDFTALAHALPTLHRSDLDPIGGGEPVSGATRAVIGAGTGLGVSGLVSDGRGAEIALCGEGGHVSLASETPEEDRILERLRERFGHVSAERVLCGPGLENLYQAMSTVAGSETARSTGAAAIAHAAGAGELRARACISQFSGWLGAVAGDLALTLGARGGVFIAGGIVPRWGRLFDRESFRQRFEAKGRYRRYLAAIPTYIIVAEHPALRGLARLCAAAHGTHPGELA